MLSSDVLVRTTTPATTTSPACSSSFVSLSSVSDAVLITHVKEYNADLLNRLVQFTQNETTLLEDQWILAPLRDSIRVTCFDEVFLSPAGSNYDACECVRVRVCARVWYSLVGSKQYMARAGIAPCGISSCYQMVIVEFNQPTYSRCDAG